MMARRAMAEQVNVVVSDQCSAGPGCRRAQVNWKMTGRADQGAVADQFRAPRDGDPRAVELSLPARPFTAQRGQPGSQLLWVISIRRLSGLASRIGTLTWRIPLS
jgi:hypothetical protein